MEQTKYYHDDKFGNVNARFTRLRFTIEPGLILFPEIYANSDLIYLTQFDVQSTFLQVT